MARDYDAFARRLIEGGVIDDPWLDGRPRFGTEPDVLEPARYRELARAGEAIAAVYDELCGVVEDDPALLDEFFGLTAFQKVMWEASRPLWHGIARADVFVTEDGLAITELNCDTPTGEAEAVELGRLALADHPGLVDPNAGLEARVVAAASVMAERLVEGEFPRAAGIVYPTEFTEDLSVVRLYRRWFERAGWSVVLGSPYNLGRDERGFPTLFDRPTPLLLRHYKTDWWGERASAWDDEPIPDALPLVEPLRAALGAFAERRAAVVNPFGAVVPQNKRAMALMWEHIHRFSPQSQGTIERLVPYTSRLETVHREQLLAERASWVLKSDYGAEGDEVVVGAHVTDEVWRASLAHARAGRWIAQRYFKAVERAAGGAGEGGGAGGEVTNYGVYVVAGEAAGLYVRAHAENGMTDARARSVPVLVG